MQYETLERSDFEGFEGSRNGCSEVCNLVTGPKGERAGDQAAGEEQHQCQAGNDGDYINEQSIRALLRSLGKTPSVEPR